MCISCILLRSPSKQLVTEILALSSEGTGEVSQKIQKHKHLGVRISAQISDDFLRKFHNISCCICQESLNRLSASFTNYCLCVKKGRKGLFLSANVDLRMTQRLVTVIWRGADSSESRLKVEFYTDDFQFADLDAWVRTRFGLDATSKLRYLRKGLETGQELCYFHSYC